MLIESLSQTKYLLSDYKIVEFKEDCVILLKHTKQLLSVTFCDTTAGIGASFKTYVREWWRRIAAEGQKYVEVDIVI